MGEEDGINIFPVVEILDIIFGFEIIDRQIRQHVVFQRFTIGKEADALILLRVLKLGDE